MSKFPVDASKRRVSRTFQLLGFLIIRENESPAIETFLVEAEVAI
jgi:hypothetical protein